MLDYCSKRYIPQVAIHVQNECYYDFTNLCSSLKSISTIKKKHFRVLILSFSFLSKSKIPFTERKHKSNNHEKGKVLLSSTRDLKILPPIEMNDV